MSCLSNSSFWCSFSNDFQGFLNSYLAGFETCALFDLENPSLQVRDGGFASEALCWSAGTSFQLSLIHI